MLGGFDPRKPIADQLDYMGGLNEEEECVFQYIYLC